MLTGLLAISAECFRPRRGYLADVREIYVLLMIPAGPRVRQPEIQTAAGGCVLRAEAGWCIMATRDEHRVRTIRTLCSEPSWPARRVGVPAGPWPRRRA